MKKNNIKQSLALSLALAMAVTSVPFSSASAAKAPTLNKTSKTLYINKNEIGSSFDFNINNKVAGSKYTWTSSSKTIATVNSKGLVKAGTKTGTATISCKITLPTKKTKTLKATVTVKENANKVTISNPTTEIGIGTNAYDFNSKMTSASGATATDYRTWEIEEASNTAGATIDAKNGKVTTTKAGEFKVRVRAYQNKTKLAANDTVDSEWLTVKVVPSVKSVAQTSTTKVAVTYDDNMKETVKASDFSIRNKATNVVSAIKDIEFSEDGKVVTVDTFVSYADNSTYVLTYQDKEFEFATSIGEVASIEVTTLTVVENKETEIKYVLKNANGVDITDAKSSTVTIEEVENNDGWLNGNKVTIFRKGSTAKVKLTYHTYKYNETGSEEGAVSVDATITAVEETAATIGAYKNYVITDKSSVNFDKITANQNVIAVGEERNLFLKAVDSNKNDVTGLTFESGNENMLLVSTSGNNAILTAVKEGSTVVVVKNEKGTVLWTLPVVIKAERKANSISLAKSSVTLVANTDIATEKVEVKIKDQHNDDYTVIGNFAEPVAVKSYTNGPDVKIDLTEANKISIDATSADAGTYQYKVALTSDANKLTVLTVVVKEKPATEVSSYKFDLSSNTVDTIVDEDTTTSKAIAVKVLGYASGLAVENTTCNITVTGPNGYSKTYDDNFNFEYVTVSGGAITKLDKGTYTITAVKAGKTIAKTAIVVNDTQSAPTVKLNSTTYTGSVDEETVLAAMKANTTVKNAAGVELKNSITSVNYTSNGTAVYVKSVTIAETFGTNVFTHTVTIGKTIYIK